MMFGQKRDGGRVAELYALYGPAIYARCRRLLADEALRWIYRIATNYCLNKLRDRKHEVGPLPEGLHDVEGQLSEDREVNRDLIRRLVTRTPEQLRAAVWLHYVDGLDQGEVAAV